MLLQPSYRTTNYKRCFIWWCKGY